MGARNDGKKGRQHSFHPPTKYSDVASAKTINMHTYVQPHIDLPTCDQI